ncbi:MAG: hypothetical protein NC248_05695 [Bacteroides sp.]|nr:hypothetical protein [Lachnospiraceae bacterium]MCM1332086.1 hypothetical protein [Bacteroides sp.]MCM1390246.1 hypothetical protein [Bacteroides sp.]
MNSNNYQRPPWWFIIIIIVMLLPLFSWVGVITRVLENYGKNDSISIIFFILPIYAVLSCYYAYKSYEARKELSWILLCVLLLSYAGCYFLL